MRKRKKKMDKTKYYAVSGDVLKYNYIIPKDKAKVLKGKFTVFGMEDGKWYKGVEDFISAKEGTLIFIENEK